MAKNFKVVLGCDHAGWPLKEAIVGYLKRRGISVLDVGCFDPQIRVDYPDYAFEAAQAVAKGSADCGILCCGTGIGMSIAANKVSGIRAAVVWDQASARLAREHNWANVLCLGGRHFTSSKVAKILSAFFEASPSQESRHRKRISKIGKFEKS